MDNLIEKTKSMTWDEMDRLIEQAKEEDKKELIRIQKNKFRQEEWEADLL
jgi:hypothetical protein